jgi:hypothetical protein
VVVGVDVTEVEEVAVVEEVIEPVESADDDVVVEEVVEEK